MNGTTSNNNVSYILVAEFDIDKGSTITFQYPEPTGEDTQLLAELMLPDGAHKRPEDWTIFFLGRENGSNVKKDTKPKTQAKPKVTIPKTEPLEAYLYEFAEESSQDWSLLKNEKFKVTFLYNVDVPTIEMICKDGETKILALKHPEFEYTVLEPTFICILTEQGSALGLRFAQSTDGTSFQRYLDDFIKYVPPPKGTDNNAITEGTVTSPTTTNESSNEQKNASQQQQQQKPQQFLYCLNLVINQKDDTVRRGAVVKAMAICTRHQYIDVFRPSIVLALQRFFVTPGVGVLEEFYNALNAMDISGMPQYSVRQKQIIRAANDKTKEEFSTVINYLTKLNIKIPTTLFPDEVGGFKLITLIKKFGNQVLTIYNGLLSQKRILFLGFDCSASEVCEYVLAACCMVCPPLRGLVKRAFPYTNLTYLDFLSVPGYIAGVTNPMFESHTEWWDILCNINTGKVITTPTANPQATVEKHLSYDNEFMTQVNNCISSHYGENAVRSIFESYTQHFVDMAFDEEEFPDEASRQLELESNKPRIDQWKKTLSYETYVEDRKLQGEQSAIKDPLVARYIKKLRTCKSISESEIMIIYQTFLENIKEEAQQEEFLAQLPESTGGLSTVAVGLFHPSEAVRIATARLFRRLEKIQMSSLHHNLNLFLLFAYERTLQLVKDDSL